MCSQNVSIDPLPESLVITGTGRSLQVDVSNAAVPIAATLANLPRSAHTVQERHGNTLQDDVSS